MYAFTDFLEYIKGIQSLLYSREGFAPSFADALRTAADDGITELELSVDCQIFPEFESADAVIRCLEELFAVHPGMRIRPEIGVNREWDEAKLEAWVRPLLETGYFNSIDLYGNELKGDPEVFVPYYETARTLGMRLKAHAGEYKNADFVKRSVEVLQLDEVQHGISAAQSPAVMRWLADHHIRLNVCPTSNLRLARIPDMASHPIRELYHAGVHVTINSDDILVFDQTVSEEYFNLYRAGVLNATELNAIRIAAFRD